jgi:hypothetical protein
MAFEISEGLYAGLSLVPTSQLVESKNNKDTFLGLLDVAVNNLSGSGVLDAAGNQTKNGMLREISLKKDKEKYDNLAAAISAVLGTRSNVNSSIPNVVYLTGNRWHPNVEKFKVNAYGMSDYNSSDVILQYGNLYVGISLKKKPTKAAASPTLINNAFSQFIDGPELKSTRDALNQHRIKFFASVIKEAFSPGQPLSEFASLPQNKNIVNLNPNNLSDAKILWDMKVERKKSGRVEKISLINLKTVNDLSGMDGLINPSGMTEQQRDFRNYVNRKLQSDGVLNPLYQGFLTIMNQNSEKMAQALLTRVLKINLLDELSTWRDSDFAFYLVEGVGSVNTNLSPSISTASVIDLYSLIIGIAKMAKQPSRIEVDAKETFARKAGKVFFKLYKGNMPILKLELRYKGSFTAYPQFFAYLTSEFKQFLLKGEHETR